MRRLTMGFMALSAIGAAIIAVIAVMQEDYNLNSRVALSVTPDRVWRVLNDFQRYPEWNPHLRAMEGQPQPYSKTQLKEIFADGSEVVRKIGMKSMAVNYEFIWEADLSPLPRMLIAKRKLIMTPTDNGGTDLRHEMEFSGWLSGPLSQGTFSRYAQSMAAMNAALIQRVGGGKVVLSPSLPKRTNKP